MTDRWKVRFVENQIGVPSQFWIITDGERQFIANTMSDAEMLLTALNRLEHLQAKIFELRSALIYIAAPIRPDGTWNRDRETCRQIAVAALKENT